jgi:hypothetical protein
MSMVVMTGKGMNLLSRGTVTVSDENPSFPKKNLWDGDPGEVFSFATFSDGRQVVLDTDLALGTGDMEAAHVAGAPPGWKHVAVGTGLLARDTTVIGDGAASCRLSSGASGVGVLERDFGCRAGETLTIKMYMRGDGINACTVAMQDLETGDWLNGSGLWQPAFTTFDSETSTTPFGSRSRQVVVSPMTYWPQAVRRVRLRFLSAAVAGAQAWVDSVTFRPNFDTLAIIGHNLRRGAIQLAWQGSEDPAFGGVPVDLAAPTIVKDRVYHRLSTLQSYRYTRLFAWGLNVEPPWYGELIIGASRLMARGPATPVETTHDDHRIEVARSVGGSSARGIARAIRRTKAFTFKFRDTPETAETGEWREFQQEILTRSIGGHPSLVVPMTDRGEILFGRWGGVVKETDGAPGTPGFKIATVDFEELQLPVELP